MTIWKKETANRPNLEYLRTEITELNLGVRSYNCLKRAGCNTVGDILRLIEADENGGGLRKIRNLGSRSEEEILERLEQFKTECAQGTGRFAADSPENQGRCPADCRGPFTAPDGRRQCRSGYCGSLTGPGGSRACRAECRRPLTTPDGSPMPTRAQMRSDETIWESCIDNYHLSNYARTRLEQKGIHQVRDLYATDPDNEPGWYAVRELFEKLEL